MEKFDNRIDADQMSAFDKYPCYYGDDLELVYTPEKSIFKLWVPWLIESV